MTAEELPEKGSEEEESLVELDLETGEVLPIESKPPGVVYEFVRKLGQALVDFAEKQTSAAISLEIALDAYKSKEKLLKVMFSCSLILLAGAAELVLPFLGLLVLTGYFFYFSILNLSGTQGTVDRLKQAVMMSSMQKQDGSPPLLDPDNRPGAGQYL